MAEGMTQEDLDAMVRTQTRAVMAGEMQKVVEVIAKPYEERLESVFAVLAEISDISMTLPEETPQRALIGAALQKLKK